MRGMGTAIQARRGRTAPRADTWAVAVAAVAAMAAAAAAAPAEAAPAVLFINV